MIRNFIKTTLIAFVLMLSIIPYSFADNNIQTNDGIRILEIVPNSGLIDGVSTKFKVKVAYTLLSSEEADLFIGFNNNILTSKEFRIYDKKTISKGSGEYIFFVEIIPKNWFQNDDFKVYVNLSPSERGVSWKSYCDDEKVLTFK